MPAFKTNDIAKRYERLWGAIRIIALSSYGALGGMILSIGSSYFENSFMEALLPAQLDWRFVADWSMLLLPMAALALTLFIGVVDIGDWLKMKWFSIIFLGVWTSTFVVLIIAHKDFLQFNYRSLWISLAAIAFPVLLLLTIAQSRVAAINRSRINRLPNSELTWGNVLSVTREHAASHSKFWPRRPIVFISALSLFTFGLITLCLGGVYLAFVGIGMGRIIESTVMLDIEDVFNLVGGMSAPLCLALLAMIVAFFCLRIGKAQWRTAMALRLDEVESPVLLLRSFQDDSKQITSTSLIMRLLRRRKRLEEAVADYVSQSGFFVAIGQPGERLPQLGAYRFYTADDEWQQAVTHLVAKSTKVVVIAGLTPWLKWEVGQLIRGSAMEKAVLVFPPCESDERQARFQLLNEALVGTDWTINVREHLTNSVVAIAFLNGGRLASAHHSGPAGEIDYQLGLKFLDFARICDQNYVLTDPDAM